MRSPLTVGMQVGFQTSILRDQRVMRPVGLFINPAVGCAFIRALTRISGSNWKSYICFCFGQQPAASRGHVADWSLQPRCQHWYHMATLGWNGWVYFHFKVFHPLQPLDYMLITSVTVHCIISSYFPCLQELSKINLNAEDSACSTHTHRHTHWIQWNHTYTYRHIFLTDCRPTGLYPWALTSRFLC